MQQIVKVQVKSFPVTFMIFRCVTPQAHQSAQTSMWQVTLSLLGV